MLDLHHVSRTHAVHILDSAESDSRYTSWGQVEARLCHGSNDAGNQDQRQ
jgi:hypothetical protein